MSLLQKLTQDRLQRNCQIQVQELHQVFVHWFLGTRPKEELQEDLKTRLQDNFSHVAPNGQFLKGRSNLIEHLDEKYGCYSDRVFQIDIYNVQLLWTDSGKCLCTYEEWQSWQQDESSAEVNQFGRLSTCLLQQDSNGKFRWIHVHETWLEAEAPEHPSSPRQVPTPAALEASISNFDDDTVMTGPVPREELEGNRKDYGTVSEITDSLVEEPPRILLLVSNQIISKAQKENQEVAYQILTTSNIPHETLDGSDPSNRDERNGLFKTSRVWGKYPQIFTRDGIDAKPAYWGNVSRLNESNEKGTLRTDLGFPADLSVDRGLASMANGQGVTVVPPSPAQTALKIDSPSTTSEGDDQDQARKHVLVLISKQSLSREQMSVQDKALTVLKAKRIPHEILDGAAPENRFERNELFKLSSSWGKYPQFFVVSANGNKEFWGGRERFEVANEEGKLKEDLGFGEDKDDPKGSYHPRGSVIADLDEPPSESEGSLPPEAATSLPVAEGDRLLVLISRQSLTKNQMQTQDKLVAALDAHKVSYDTLDGADSSQRDRRNELFRVSQIWGKYPQLFYVAPDGSTTFWGDHERFEEANENGTLLSALADKGGSNYQRSAPAKPEEKKEVDTPAVISKPSSFEEAVIPSGTASGAEDHILVLVSKQRVSDQQVEAQDKSFDALVATNIPFDTIDGSDSGLRARRNELFRMSENWGKYPQFFHVSSAGKTTFWGDWARFEAASGKGTLREDMGFSTAESPNGDASQPMSEDRLLLLVSEQSLTKEQMAYQQHAYDILSSLNIRCEKLDGSIPGNRVRRNELFRLSQSWGKYPQVFKITTDGTTTFWGGRERLEDSEEKGTLKEDLGMDIDASVQLQRQPSSVTFAAKSKSNDNVASAPNNEVSSDDGLVMETDDESMVGEVLDAAEQEAEEHFLHSSQGILQFEEEEGDNPVQGGDGSTNEKTPNPGGSSGSVTTATSGKSPIPQDISSKRHISPKLEQFAKPLTWENVLVGVSISGFDVGTSQGPIGDSLWYHETGDILEDMAQPRGGAHPRRKLALPEMVFPTAHVALEGHGVWLSFDVNDALEEWAQAHQEIAINASNSHRGVNVLKSKDAELWDSKKAVTKTDPNSSSVFHYDWTYSTPFAGKLEGGEWVELDETGIRTELLTDQSVPILFFDEIILFEDDLHDNGQSQFTVKLRVMPSCAYILARFWLRVDNVLVRMRETRVMVDFFGLKPKIYRDVTWRECTWERLTEHGLPAQVKLWNLEGRETPAWAAQLRKIPEVDPPDDVYKYAVMA